MEGIDLDTDYWKAYRKGFQHGYKYCMDVSIAPSRAKKGDK